MQTLPLRLPTWIAGPSRPLASEPPLRAELFTVEQLAQHGETLAGAHRVAPGLGSNDLLARLAANEERLREFNRATLRVSPSRHVTPAAEWLLDNFYLIEEQIHLARRHLPRGYSRELPRLVAGPSTGLPRVYDLMLELIAHVDAQVDVGALGAFIAAYQRTTPLKLGELWAIPIMLRLGVLENLQRVTTWLTIARHDRDLADSWVDRLQDTAEKNPSGLVIVVADMAKSDPPLSSSFVAEFCQRLSRKNPVLHLARSWLEQRLGERGLSIEDLIQQETQAQAADQVSVSNSITSLRLLGALDWKEFVESLSVVERILATDPAGVYPRMDFATRDRYRHEVETLARHGGLAEPDVARRAVGLASGGTPGPAREGRAGHVGFYLIDAGRDELEHAMKLDWPWRIRVERSVRRHPLAFYPGGILVLTLLGTGGFYWAARGLGLRPVWLAAATVLLALGASQLAVALVNLLATLLVRPRLLPRLDYAAGIPSADRTMVVVPTMLGSAEAADRLVENLEIHHLANRDPQLSFALLTDFPDAPEENMPDDEAWVRRAQAGIERLNAKYPREDADAFFLFHRPRRWNPGEGRWMGYERKRGKLTEFTALLRGGPRGAFATIAGRTGPLEAIRYVITLDTDTQLPREAAQRLVSTLAHPLNRPRLDPARGIVTRGYGILQPRVAVSMAGAGQSRFAQLFAGEAGIDPYTRAVSDVYQDVFGEGSFIGKGIFDVEVFQRVLGERFPENKVLSHDLLEACHLRSALVSDVELYEDYPARYNVDVARRHRWIRGDWQICQWLFSHVPGPGGRALPNVLSPLSQWKIFDNLRRSLVPVALLALLAGSWMFSPRLAGMATAAVLAILLGPGALTTLVEAVRKPADLPWRMHGRGLAGTAGRQLAQAGLNLVFLPYDALISADAISRTLLRLLVTRKRLLEWQTSVDSARQARTGLASHFANMGIAPALGLAVVYASPLDATVPAVLGGLWLMAPGLAWWISRPTTAEAPDLTGTQQTFLRQLARKTWWFFETFVTADENWLPPDNFQEVPDPIVATRTSPTNLGLALLANLAARDFGYLSTGGMITRTENTLGTMQRLERYRGHFYNWYETRPLRPLPPLYVSTVDSGNLACHLLTLGAGLREVAEQGIYSPEIFAGLRDTAGILRGLTGENAALDRLDELLVEPPDSLCTAGVRLEKAVTQTAALAVALAVKTGDAKKWSEALHRDCAAHQEELRRLAPWLNGAASPVPARGELAGKLAQLDRIPTLREVAGLDQTLCPLLEAERENLPPPGPLRERQAVWLEAQLQAFREASDFARQRLVALESLARQCDELANMDFTFLSDPVRKLFAIGFNVTAHRRDTGYFDLLASEARVASYVAIAEGQVSQDHWFSLSRLLVATPLGPILVSWSGSMFEYLMPMLVMPSYENTLLDRTCRAAVRQQIDYAQARGVPWGISESGYNRTDVHLNYQYRAFGVPGLGLQRGLSDDLVVAPYATVMALMVAPREACKNLRRLVAEGREGAYGLYEAVDYTASRLPPGPSSITIRSYMAHHQGMSLLALDRVLRDRPMERRFLACPQLKAADSLLQERVPNTAAHVFTDDLEPGKLAGPEGTGDATMRIFTNPTPRSPEVHLLSNGRYHVVISSAGGGYSRWRDLAVTRWREDATRDNWGSFIYLRDTATGEFWSAAHQPVLRPAKRYEAIFTQARAEFRQRQAGLEIHTEICVSPEDDVELRRIRISNQADGPRVIELTSYAEVVLAPSVADEVHPAFSNLFVQTEFVPAASAILCTRRARSSGEKPPWLVHLLVGEGGELGDVSCETDRARFIGRGRTPAAPAALQAVAALSNTAGSVLDPIIALRRTVTLPPHETAVLDLVLGVGESREAAQALAAKYQNARMADRAFDLAWTHSQVTLRHLNATEAEAQLYGRMAGALIYADPTRRAAPAVLQGNRRGQSGLWSYGISGDTPIVLLRITVGARLELVRQLVQAHSYWRMKGLAVELLIINEDTSVYRQSLHDQILGLISAGTEAQMLDKPGGIFVRRLEQIPHEDRILLQSAARIVLDDEQGSLAQQLELVHPPELPAAALIPSRTAGPDQPRPLAPRELIFMNGLGGFTRDGHEYVMTLADGRKSPAPWVNVLANPYFGTVVSESGGGYTWLENAHEFRLTPWSNDPVQDPVGEALYLRDEQTGRFWSPTPQPARGATPYVVRHGFGYTVFEHTEQGIASEVWIYVAVDAPVKFAVVKLRNVSGRDRRISVTGYWEWVLGELRQRTLLHVQTEVDRKTGALLAHNHYSADFADRTAFVDVSDATRTLTGDRREFLGRHGSLAQPAALKRARLSGKVGAGLDPCGALQVTLDLPGGQERETVFRLGVGRNAADVQNLIQRFRRPEAGRAALEGVWAYWNRTLGAVNVDTPDPAVNVMANGWLLYQTLSCRLWGRTGFYQSGGAYGFRDQLQDVMALVHAEPTLTREHLLRAAARQFKEGDVQHWWHPPAGRGVRTHFSDDYLWLPYATCRYVRAVADTGVLEEKIPLLAGRPVKPEEEAYYDLPARSPESATLYDHCVRAIEHGLKFGEHGLPLMGCGDWNDGMNLVGHEGRGESVWLAFFLHAVLTQFAGLARARGDAAFADRCEAQAAQLQGNIERHAWDGAWYRRAYFDNGEPLGSQANPECQIDSLPQSWSVISGAGDPEHARAAMDAVDRRLVRRKDRVIQLFDPPFDHSELNPGYIKGYIPGVRENGGQYTHGAVWTAMAFALLGQGERAWELFNLLNPVHHGATPAQIATYKVEPYVVAADVYAVAPHTGRGGWTWYTGSAGWMYRLLVETLLGANLEGTQLRLSPRMPAAWPGYKIHYRYRQTVYHLTITRVAADAPGVHTLTLDGREITYPVLPLVDDRQEHAAELKIT